MQKAAIITFLCVFKIDLKHHTLVILSKYLVCTVFGKIVILSTVMLHS